MFKFFLTLTILVAGVLFFSPFVSATSPFDIEFPIPELGNCADKDACKTYCDDPVNREACVEFARKHNLIDQETAEKVKRLPAVGPGGCRGEAECRAYCEDPAHFDKCLAFAEEHDLLPEEEIERVRDFSNLTGPGGCRGANECRAYCEDPAHHEECLNFAHRKGLISDQRAEEARKVLSIVKDGGPGGCRSEPECHAYCEDPAHLDECLAFGEQHGFISKEEAQRIRKQGLVEGPGGCKFEECRVYCEDPAHQAECIDWAVENGFMSEEEAQFARKFAGKTGPGGCVGESCRDFCDSPDNVEICIEFAEREGLVPFEELERGKRFLRAVREEGGPGGCRSPRECQAFCENPANQEICFEFAKSKGFISDEELKHFEAGRNIDKVVQEKGGPGGCRNERDCMAYCSEPSHVEECVAFGATHSGLSLEEVQGMLRDFTEQRFRAHGEFRPPEDFRRFEMESRNRFEEFRALEENFRGFDRPQEFVGPGGCASPQECIQYCKEHREECFSFGPPGTPRAVPPEGGVPPGIGFPRIREDAIHVTPRDIPHDEFGRCVEENIRQIDRSSLQTNPEEFFRQKERAFRTCEEALRGRSEAPPSGEFPPGGFPGEFRPEREFTFSPEEGVRLREKLGIPEVFQCVKQIIGEERARTLRDRVDFDQSAKDVLIRCFEKFQTPFQPPSGEVPPPGEVPQPFPAICPAMPTVESCPEGYKEVVAFSSPECGTYYACEPAEGFTAPTSATQPNPAEECRAHGGVWNPDTNYCQFPTSSSGEAPREGFFAGLLDLIFFFAK